MERIKHLKNALLCCAETQVDGHLGEVDAQELGEVIDMIKDLEEACYYHTITEAMHEGSEYDKHYYTTRYPREPYDPWKKEKRMPDSYEGRSKEPRRRYMEGKEYHYDRNRQMKELEDYLKELSEDITEMLEDATEEEKSLLASKMTALANKIV